MKKGIAIGILAIASIILIGCQQQPPVTPTPGEGGPQTATTTATVTVEEGGNTVDSTGTLVIQPAGEAEAPTEVSTTGSLEIEPSPATTPVIPPPIVPPTPPVIE